MVELWVELVSFCTWIGDEALLVKLFGDLTKERISIDFRRRQRHIRPKPFLEQALATLKQLSGVQLLSKEEVSCITYQIQLDI